MKINGMQRMLGALLSAAIVTGSTSVISVVGLFAVIPTASAQTGSRHYSDDAIVRDLKAGKLTVKEAEMLRARRDHAEAQSEVHPEAHPATHAKQVRVPAHGAHADLHARHKPVSAPRLAKAGKSGAGVARQKPEHAGKNRRAPVRHLTTAHASTVHKAHGKAGHGDGHKDKVAHGKHGRKHAGKAQVARADTDSAAPVPRRAVKYIR